MEKKFYSPPKIDEDAINISVKDRKEILIENQDYEYLINKVALLKENLAQSLEKEQCYIRNILNLETQQQRYYEDRKNKIIKYRKSKSSSSILSPQLASLDENVRKLILKYDELYTQNQSLQKKLKNARTQINKQVKESQIAVINVEKRLMEEKSSQNDCENAIQRLSRQIQKLKDEKEIISNKKLIDSQNRHEISIQTEKVNSLLKSRQEEMQNLQIDLETAIIKYESLFEEKNQRIQSFKKKNNYDDNQIKESIDIFLNERRKYSKKIKKINENDIADLNFQIERASKELSHLIEAHEMRKKKQMFIENSFDH